MDAKPSQPTWLAFERSTQDVPKGVQVSRCAHAGSAPRDAGAASSALEQAGHGLPEPQRHSNGCSAPAWRAQNVGRLRSRQGLLWRVKRIKGGRLVLRTIWAGTSVPGPWLCWRTWLAWWEGRRLRPGHHRPCRSAGIRPNRSSAPARHSLDTQTWETMRMQMARLQEGAHVVVSVGQVCAHNNKELALYFQEEW